MELQEPRRIQPSKSASQKLVVYYRLPQLLIEAAIRQVPFTKRRFPLVVVQDQNVRAACNQAEAAGISVGQSVVKARRLYPALTTILLEAIDHRPETSAFLDALADLSPIVDPDGPDSAFAVMHHSDIRAVRNLASDMFTCLGPSVVGIGSSRLAAYACAESGLSPDHLADASVQWLWPDDPKVVAALLRLGLETFGQVAAVGEGALFYQFGKIGRLLHRRSLGQDLLPVRPLWPPVRSDAVLHFDEFALTQRSQMEAAVMQVCQQAEAELRVLGRHGRRVVLRVTTEAGAHRREWSLPAPVQSAAAVRSAATRLLSQMTLSAPVTELRLLVEELETPTARTNDLFLRGPGDDPAALEAVRRSLQTRFGNNGVFVLGQKPRSVREDRRACLHEKWQTFQ